MKENSLLKKCLFSFLLLFLLSLCLPQTSFAAGRPGKVQGLKCGVTTASSINISWKHQNNVSGYQVFRSTSYDGPFKKIKSISAGNHAFCNMNLQSGREYYYRVRAYRGNATGKLSKILTARTKCPARAATVRVSSNVRSHAGTNHTVIAGLAPGTKVSVICTTNTPSGTPWSRISFQVNGKKKSGYIRSDLLTAGQSSPSHKGVVTAASGLHLRKSASAGSKIITTLPKGTTVTILKGVIGSDGQKWYHIKVKRNGKKLKGYAFAKYIRVS